MMGVLTLVCVVESRVGVYDRRMKREKNMKGE